MADDAGAGRTVQPGSRVTVRSANGRRSLVWIESGDRVTTTFDVGADRPLAIALLGKRVGNHVRLELAPGAVLAVNIIRIA